MTTTQTARRLLSLARRSLRATVPTYEPDDRRERCERFVGYRMRDTVQAALLALSVDDAAKVVAIAHELNASSWRQSLRIERSRRAMLALKLADYRARLQEANRYGKVDEESAQLLHNLRRYVRLNLIPAVRRQLDRMKAAENSHLVDSIRYAMGKGRSGMP